MLVVVGSTRGEATYGVRESWLLCFPSVRLCAGGGALRTPKTILPSRAPATGAITRVKERFPSCEVLSNCLIAGEPYIAYGLSPFLRPVGRTSPALESALCTVLVETANSAAASATAGYFPVYAKASSKYAAILND